MCEENKRIERHLVSFLISSRFLQSCRPNLIQWSPPAIALPAPYYLANPWERRIKIPGVSSGVSWFGRVVRLSALSCPDQPRMTKKTNEDCRTLRLGAL